MLDAIKLVLSSTNSTLNQDVDLDAQLKELISDEQSKDSLLCLSGDAFEEEF